MFKRVQDALSDLQETLRRTFGGVGTRETEVGFPLPGIAASAGLEPPASQEGLHPLRAVEGRVPWEATTRLQEGAVAFPCQVLTEAGWACWSSESRALGVPLFQGGSSARLEVPPLPRRASSAGWSPTPFRLSLRPLRDPLRSPGTRAAAATLPRPPIRQDLGLAFGRPFRFPGQPLASLPKPLQMRYTLQLVKATGANIREIEVLGLFRIPKKGVGQMKVDPPGLLVTLSETAARAPRGLLLLARRNPDQAILSCFLEEP